MNLNYHRPPGQGGTGQELETLVKGFARQHGVIDGSLRNWSGFHDTICQSHQPVASVDGTTEAGDVHITIW